MSDITPKLQLPLILPAQAQKHVTHNEALKRLDVITQMTVLSRSVTAPPTTAQDGDSHIVPAGATGDWSGHDGKIATLETAVWQFIEPSAGWLCWVEDDQGHAYHDGTDWGPFSADVPDQVTQLGVGTGADANNPLTAAGPGTLFTHAGTDHRLTVNKAAPADTASMVLQTGWSGRAEIGLCGDDDLSVKVSPDGTTFYTAMTVDNSDGSVSFPQGVAGLSPAEFGPGPIATTDYVNSRGVDLVTNGTAILGNSYNYPAGMTYDSLVAPNLRASVSYQGYYGGLQQMEESLPVDPNGVYRLGSYLRQEALPGDFSAYANAERHMQFMGLLSFDSDGQQIMAHHHMRYRVGTTDSLTTLAAPLSPGDTTIQVTDASGWNDSVASGTQLGVIIFGYRNQAGQSYQRYSRHVAFDLFATAGVNKTTHQITLNAPLPATMGNPDDANGTWPAGTEIANSSSGSSFKYSFYSALVPAQADTWYRTTSFVGGIDNSGTNQTQNFPPGTASVKVFWLPNYSNRNGGWTTYPDTGAAQRVWFAGVSVRPSDTGRLVPSTTPGQDGAMVIEVPTADTQTGALSLAAAGLEVTEIG